MIEIVLLFVFSLAVGAIIIFVWFFFYWNPDKKFRSDSISFNQVIISFFLIVVLVISLIRGFGKVYEQTGLINSEGSIIKDKGVCFYFSVVTFTTLGYGDFKPTKQSRMVAATEAALGYVCLGILVGTVLYVLTKIGK